MLLFQQQVRLPNVLAKKNILSLRACTVCFKSSDISASVRYTGGDVGTFETYCSTLWVKITVCFFVAAKHIVYITRNVVILYDVTFSECRLDQIAAKNEVL